MLKVICSRYHYVLFAFLYRLNRWKMESPTETDQSRFSKMPVLSLFLKKATRSHFRVAFYFCIKTNPRSCTAFDVEMCLILARRFKTCKKDSFQYERLCTKTRFETDIRAARKWLFPTFGLLWQQLDGYIFYGLKTNRQAGEYSAEERRMPSYIADTGKSD